eukprot:gene56659-biopygen49171
MPHPLTSHPTPAQTLSPAQQCGANEEVKTCGTPCQDYCGKPMGSCAHHCVMDQCECKTGYVRATKSKTAPCITRQQCPTNPPTSAPVPPVTTMAPVPPVTTMSPRGDLVNGSPL